MYGKNKVAKIITQFNTKTTSTSLENELKRPEKHYKF